MVLGAVIGFVLSCVIGAVWYHPVFLGSPWMKGAHPGKSARQIGEGAAQAIYITILSSSTVALLLQFILLNTLKVTCVKEAASIGFGLGCLLLLADVSHCAYGKRSFVAFLVDHAYDIVIMTVMAVSIVYCNKYGLTLPISFPGFPGFPGSSSSTGSKKSDL